MAYIIGEGRSQVPFVSVSLKQIDILLSGLYHLIDVHT